jgi:hypothetical protein
MMKEFKDTAAGDFSSFDTKFHVDYFRFYVSRFLHHIGKDNRIKSCDTLINSLFHVPIILPRAGYRDKTDANLVIPEKHLMLLSGYLITSVSGAILGSIPVYAHAIKRGILSIENLRKGVPERDILVLNMGDDQTSSYRKSEHMVSFLQEASYYGNIMGMDFEVENRRTFLKKMYVPEMRPFAIITRMVNRTLSGEHYPKDKIVARVGLIDRLMAATPHFGKLASNMSAQGFSIYKFLFVESVNIMNRGIWREVVDFFVNLVSRVYDVEIILTKPFKGKNVLLSLMDDFNVNSTYHDEYLRALDPKDAKFIFYMRKAIAYYSQFMNSDELMDVWVRNRDYNSLGREAGDLLMLTGDKRMNETVAKEALLTTYVVERMGLIKKL